MRRAAFLLLLLAAPLLQSSIVYPAALQGVRLDLALAMAAAAGLAGGIWAGALAGFGAGLAVGIVGGAPLGPLALAYLAAGWAAGILGRRGWGRSAPTVAAAGAVCSALLWGVEAAAFRALGMGGGAHADAVALFVALQAVLTVPVAPLARWLLLRRAAENPRPIRRKRLVRALASEAMM